MRFFLGIGVTCAGVLLALSVGAQEGAQEEKWKPLTPEPDDPNAQPAPLPTPKPPRPDPPPRQPVNDTPPEERLPADEPPPPEAYEPLPYREPLSDGESASDEVRFRGGVMVGFGGLLISGNGADINLFGPTLVGNLGVQFIDEFALYAALRTFTLSFDSDQGLLSGAVGASLVAEGTFINRIFVGGGPSFAYVGAVDRPFPGFHVRVGAYPGMGFGDNGIRRHGFMLGFDLRGHFLDGFVVLEPVGMLGYEAF
jgi:hypothetical protein